MIAIATIAIANPNQKEKQHPKFPPKFLPLGVVVRLRAISSVTCDLSSFATASSQPTSRLVATPRCRDLAIQRERSPIGWRWGRLASKFHSG